MSTPSTTVRSGSLALATLAGAALLLPGCLIGSRTSSRVEGSYVGSETLGSIQPKSTKKDYVLATLGEPTSRASLDNGGEIWRYCYTRRKDYSGHVFLVFSARNTDDIARTTFVHFDNNGVVERVWQESSDASK